jgi:serine/threonine protein kinase
MMMDDYKLGELIYEDPILNMRVHHGETEKEGYPVIIKVYPCSVAEDADRFLKAALRSVYCYPRTGIQLHGLAFSQGLYDKGFQVNWALDLQGGELDHETMTRDDGNLSLPQALQEYEEGELLYDSMRNNQLKVFKGKSKQGHNVLIKRYWRSRYGDLTRPVKEMLHMARAAHPNICRIFDMSIKYSEMRDYHIDFVTVYEDTSNYLLIYPHERFNRGDKLPEAEMLTVLRDTSAALEHAKTRGIAHRDLKPDSIFRAPNGVYKLGEFNSTYERYIKCVALESLDSIPYICPDLRSQMMNKKRDQRKPISPYVSDVFSLGMSLLHAACLDYPGSVVITEIDKLQEAIQEELHRIPYSIYFKRLLGDMLRVASEQRPTIEEVHVRTMFFLTPSPMPLFQSQTSFPYEMDSFADFIIPANAQMLSDEARSQVKDFERIDNYDGPELFVAINRVAVLLRHQGKLEEALEKVESSLPTLRERMDIFVAVGISNKALLLMQLGRLKEAEECARKSLEERLRVFPEENYTHANGYSILSAVLKAKGAISEAAEALAKAVAVAQRTRAWAPVRIADRQRELASLV